MTKKSQQSSGPSYSLIALLKRTLFLHETAKIEELVEEVHEYMLKDQPYDQIKTKYIEPILRNNPSFIAIQEESNIWRLTEGNKVNDAIYEMFQKYKTPLSERQILNRLAKAEHLAKITITLDLKNDARFADLEGGKYWILSEWVVINEYARSVLLKLKGGLTENELVNKIVEEYHLDPDSAIFIPMLDERFVKKDKKWTLKKFVEQKTKLRASLIDRLHKHLQKIGTPLSAGELTTIVLNMPANATDVDEKLTVDPRFVLVDGKWDLRERLEKKEEVLVVPKTEPVQERPSVFEQEILPAELEREIEPTEGVIAEESQLKEIGMGKIPPRGEGIEPEFPEIAGEVGKLVEEEGIAAEAEEFPERPEKEEETVEEKAELLRKKVVDFLQDAFHSEGIVYSADIIDQLVTAEEKAEILEQFSLEHFANPAKNRELTDSDIIKFMVYLAEPTLNDKIVDPCCGTGGFLIQILNTFQVHLRDALWTEKDLTIQYELRTGQFYFVQLTQEEYQSLTLPLDDAFVRRLPIERFCKQRQLTGVDSDQYAYKTTDLNIAIHGFPEIVLHQDNALTSKQIGSGVYDIVIGNPPAVEDYPTRFLRRSLLLAKPGGEILLLLPENMFSESRLVSASLRNQIIAQTIVKAVIDFPEPYNTKAYGPRRTLFYCIKKHLEAEQQTSIFVGSIPDLDGLRDIIEVLEDPTAPVSQSEEPIPIELVMFILSSYQGTAYNLLIEGLRRQTLVGELMSINNWMHSQKPDQDDE
jgi:hypothetical protein